MSRQYRLNALFAKMGTVQNQLKKENEEKRKTQTFEKPLSIEELKAHNIKRIEGEQTKMMNKKMGNKLN